MICVVAIGGAISYLARSRSDQDARRDNASPVARTNLGPVVSGPHIVFRNTNKHSDYGMVAAVAADNPAGPRAITSSACDRVYAVPNQYLCLSSTAGVITTYAAHILGADMRDLRTLPLTGIPSRARLSRDGAYAATTSFTAGDSYAGTSFSTRTVVTKVGGGGTTRDLEHFTLMHNGRSISPADRNYWGVTFAADDDTFYATVEWSKHTWLVRGSLSKATMVTLHEDAECPSLSPDGTHLVYKQRGSLAPGRWRLVDYDVASGRISLLAETRSVDDQVEWLDNAHVMYGIPRTGTSAGTDDVWTVPSDGTGVPKVLIPEAWSPAVVP
jgi:hypothetical protein